MDEQRLRFLCVDGLREKIADLNDKLNLCIEAAERMKAQWPEFDVIGGLLAELPADFGKGSGPFAGDIAAFNRRRDG